VTETVGWLIDQVFSFFRPRQKSQEVGLLLSALVNGLRGLKTVPRSPFTQTKTSGDRQGVWAEFPLTDVRTIRAAFGGSINDVAFAVIAGGMGRYMRAHSYSTEGVMLRTLCPVSLRQEDERGMLGNIISMVAPPLYVGIDDPARRMTAQREAMEQIKRDNYAGILNDIMAVADRVPPAVQRFSVPLTVNTIVPRLGSISSNVPGPQIPLYFAGHKLLRISGIAPMPTDVPMFNVILSYDQRLVLTPTVDLKCIPDPWFYVECLKESFTELRAAAEHALSSAEGAAQEAAAA
jgi:WS/DGAT/MGAT family acyltransferase